MDTCDSDLLRKLLEKRDEKEKFPFENLIYTVNEYASELESALILVDSLKSSMKRVRLSIKEPPSSSSSTNAFEVKLKELKDERTELYRQQGIQATHLLSLNDQLRSKDTLINTLTTEITALKAANEQKEQELKRLDLKVKEGEEGAKIIGDELVALQLELLRLDQWQKTASKGENISDKLDTCSNKMRIVKEKEIIAPHQYPISSYTSKPSTRQLLTGSEDQKIILYDLTRVSTKSVLKWAQMNGPIVSLAVDAEEGRMVASCSAYDREVTIWNLGSGKIQSSLQFTDEVSEAPLLMFGNQFRLWMALDRSVRLWDVQRGLLLRSWNRDTILNGIKMIQIDQKRPDRLWCFSSSSEEGSGMMMFTILNAMTGKLEIPWRAVESSVNVNRAIIIESTIDRVVTAIKHQDDDWIIKGYTRGAVSLDGAFEFSLSNDLNCKEKSIKSLSIHPDRSDLLALLFENAPDILIVKVSMDHWAPSCLLIDTAGDVDTVHWGPCEDDPITGEKGCKIVTIEKESKVIRLYTLSKI